MEYNNLHNNIYMSEHQLQGEGNHLYTGQTEIQQTDLSKTSGVDTLIQRRLAQNSTNGKLLKKERMIKKQQIQINTNITSNSNFSIPQSTHNGLEATIDQNINEDELINPSSQNLHLHQNRYKAAIETAVDSQMLQEFGAQLKLSKTKISQTIENSKQRKHLKVANNNEGEYGYNNQGNNQPNKMIRGEENSANTTPSSMINPQQQSSSNERSPELFHNAAQAKMNQKLMLSLKRAVDSSIPGQGTPGQGISSNSNLQQIGKLSMQGSGALNNINSSAGSTMSAGFHFSNPQNQVRESRQQNLRASQISNAYYATSQSAAGKSIAQLQSINSPAAALNIKHSSMIQQQQYRQSIVNMNNGQNIRQNEYAQQQKQDSQESLGSQESHMLMTGYLQNTNLSNGQVLNNSNNLLTEIKLRHIKKNKQQMQQQNSTSESLPNLSSHQNMQQEQETEVTSGATQTTKVNLFKNNQIKQKVHKKQKPISPSQLPQDDDTDPSQQIVIKKNPESRQSKISPQMQLQAALSIHGQQNYPKESRAIIKSALAILSNQSPNHQTNNIKDTSSLDRGSSNDRDELGFGKGNALPPLPGKQGKILLDQNQQLIKSIVSTTTPQNQFHGRNIGSEMNNLNYTEIPLHNANMNNSPNYGLKVVKSNAQTVKHSIKKAISIKGGLQDALNEMSAESSQERELNQFPNLQSSQIPKFQKQLQIDTNAIGQGSPSTNSNYSTLPKASFSHTMKTKHRFFRSNFNLPVNPSLNQETIITPSNRASIEENEQGSSQLSQYVMNNTLGKTGIINALQQEQQEIDLKGKIREFKNIISNKGLSENIKVDEGSQVSSKPHDEMIITLKVPLMKSEILQDSTQTLMSAFSDKLGELLASLFYSPPSQKPSDVLQPTILLDDQHAAMLMSPPELSTPSQMHRSIDKTLQNNNVVRYLVKKGQVLKGTTFQANNDISKKISVRSNTSMGTQLHMRRNNGSSAEVGGNIEISEQQAQQIIVEEDANENRFNNNKKQESTQENLNQELTSKIQNLKNKKDPFSHSRASMIEQERIQGNQSIQKDSQVNHNQNQTLSQSILNQLSGHGLTKENLQTISAQGHRTEDIVDALTNYINQLQQKNPIDQQIIHQNQNQINRKNTFSRRQGLQPNLNEELSQALMKLEGNHNSSKILEEDEDERQQYLAGSIIIGKDIQRDDITPNGAISTGVASVKPPTSTFGITQIKKIKKVGLTGADRSRQNSQLGFASSMSHSRKGMSPMLDGSIDRKTSVFGDFKIVEMGAKSQDSVINEDEDEDIKDVPILNLQKINDVKNQRSQLQQINNDSPNNQHTRSKNLPHLNKDASDDEEEAPVVVGFEKLMPKLQKLQTQRRGTFGQRFWAPQQSVHSTSMISGSEEDAAEEQHFHHHHHRELHHSKVVDSDDSDDELNQEQYFPHNRVKFGGVQLGKNAQMNGLNVSQQTVQLKDNDSDRRQSSSFGRDDMAEMSNNQSEVGQDFSVKKIRQVDQKMLRKKTIAERDEEVADDVGRQLYLHLQTLHQLQNAKEDSNHQQNLNNHTFSEDGESPSPDKNSQKNRNMLKAIVQALDSFQNIGAHKKKQPMPTNLKLTKKQTKKPGKAAALAFISGPIRVSDNGATVTVDGQPNEQFMHSKRLLELDDFEST